MFFSSEYNNILDNILEQNKITEYYLLNAEGWFLCIDHNGYEYYFFFFSDDEIDETAKEADINAIDGKYCK